MIKVFRKEETIKMRKKKISLKKITFLGCVAISGSISLLSPSKLNPVEATHATRSHIGTFDESTTFTTSSSNDIHPGLFIEVIKLLNKQLTC